MRKVSITFLRSASSTLHSNAFNLKGHPSSFPLFNTLASEESRYSVASPEDGEGGALKHSVLSEISVGDLGKREKRTRRLKADRVDCVKQDLRGTEGSLLVEISTGGKAKTRGTRRPNASKKAAGAEELNHIALGEKVSEPTEIGFINAEKLNTEIGVAHAENVEDVASHVKANAVMPCVHKQFSELAANLELNTYRRGPQWEETAHDLLAYRIPLAYVHKMLQKCKQLACARHCVDTTLQHFASLGMSHKDMGRAIAGWPTILNITNAMFQSKVEYFESVGIDRSTLGKMICVTPGVIVNSLGVLKQHFAFWDNYMRDVEGNVAIMLSKNSQLLTLNLERTVKPKLVYLLEELGIEKRVLFKHPRMLNGIKLPTLQARVSNLIASGFSLDQVRTIITRCPSLLSLSEDHINLKLRYALNVMNLSHDALVASHPYWTGSFEKRIKYRYEVIQELRAQGTCRKQVTAGYMVGMTEAEFTRKFVKKLQRHPDVPSV